ncbi:glycosyltransferase family 4 protein [Succinatimonas hippei]|uniref:glycosyltransferase family 4 protein n=1 Tax=Succinatimonas hippei TaxID=626938 RepID=UPI0025A3D920|nr:glycosyltransferase family 4 protein [Succinatimonas hippei]MDM8119940.1 glycosyltransferase family 4 protein [Succinatimonas hippei]
MIKLFVFCENKNTVNLANTIFSDYLHLIDIKFITYDWTNIVINWVNSIKTINNTEFENIHNSSYKLSTSDRVTLQNSIYLETKQFLLNHTDRTTLLFFSDCSVRGYAISKAAQDVGIKRILVQDGHLEFETPGVNIQKLDQNAYYGATLPEQIFVWGEGIKLRIKRWFKADDASISVVGKVESETSSIIKLERDINKPLHILWADQPILDQKKIDKSSYIKEIEDIVAILKQYDTTLKFHPSTTSKTKELIKNIISNTDIKIIEDGFISDEDLTKYDLVFTYFSTIYTQAIKVKVPVIFYCLRSCRIWMPSIGNEFIKNCYNLEELSDFLKKYDINNIFEPNEITSTNNLSYYLKRRGAQKDIATYIINNDDNVPYEKDIILNLCDSNISLDLFSKSLIPQIPKNVLIISHDFSLNTGVAVSALNFGDYITNNLGVNCKYYIINGSTTLEDLQKITSTFSYIVINSVAAFFRYSTLLDFIKTLSKKKYIYIYVHESSMMFEHALKSKKMEINTKKFIAFAKNLFFLFVSNKQKDELKKFNIINGVVVYNCISQYVQVNCNISHKELFKNPNYKRILMIGSIQPRKGVDLFVKTSRLSKSIGNKYKFIWIGSITKDWNEPLPYDVDWLGKLSKEQTLFCIQQCDVVFISSLEESFSLVAAEAALFNKKVVCYSQLGITELFDDTIGFYTFNEYTESAALSAIEKAIITDDVNTKKIVSPLLINNFSLNILLLLRLYREDASLFYYLNWIKNKNELIHNKLEIKAQPTYSVKKRDIVNTVNVQYEYKKQDLLVKLISRFIFSNKKRQKFIKNPYLFYKDAPFYISWLRIFFSRHS